MPVRTNIQVTGVKEAIFAGDKMKDHDGRKVREGLLDCLDLIFDDSQRRVPKETGDLAASAKKMTHGAGFLFSAWIEYGGPSAPYAWIVHEDVVAEHAPPTQAKYLSDAVYLNREECARRVRRQFYSKSFPVPRGG